MTTHLQAAGATDNKESHWAPIYTNRFFFGLSTNRNPLRSPSGVIYETYYRLGGTDAMIGGVNAELSIRLTVTRRPGNTAGLSPFISSANIPDTPDAFYSFHEIGGNIRVFADTPTAPYIIGGFANGSGTSSQGVIPIFTKAAGVTQSFFQGIGQALYFSDAKEQQKWLDFGAGNPGNSFAAITNTSLTGNVATITSINNFAPGQTVVISGTTNGSGAFNTTAVITSANSTQFQFNLTHANIGSASDTGFANATWNLQITAPKVAPTINIVSSGSAATTWQASTYFLTMGLIHDAGTGTAQQLISVNALGGNTTQFGTSGNGQPPWNQTPGGTTTDNTGGGTITWTNWGPVGTWAPGKTFLNDAVGGSLTQPALIFDPTTGHIQVNGAPGNASGVTGGAFPHFTGVLGSAIWDGTVKWFDEGAPGTWLPGHSYPAYLNNGGRAFAAVSEPILPPSTSQTLFYQISGGGTSGTGYTPAFQAAAGNQTTDNQLTWLSQGSDTWTAATNYTAWSGTQPVFGVVLDANNNFQVCVTTGTSGTLQPLPQWVAAHVYALNFQIADTNGFVQKVTTNGTSGSSKTLSNSVLTSGVATYTSAAHGFSTGALVTVTGSTHNAAFNVVNGQITSTTTNTFTVNIAHDDITTAADTGNADAGPIWNQTPGGTTTDGSVTWTNQGAENAGGRPAGWGFTYGSKTPDGTVVWANVGPPVTWAANTQWHLPSVGYFPPSQATSVGGSEVIGNAFVQAVIKSGKSAASPTPSFSTTVGNFVLDPSTVNNQITWQNVGAQQTNSLAFTKGYSWVYAFKSRAVSDLYSPQALGGGGVLFGLSASTPPPLIDQALANSQTPSGSADGSVSTASPSVTTTGSNPGAVIFVSGFGSTDPQVDTIEIYRTLDGGATLFWLTDIKSPAPVNGNAQPWTYPDSLPDVATATSGGLNTLVLAPIAHSNDAPLAGAINLVQYFGRIWYSVGATVYCSQGPNVGGPSQPPGNGYTAFNPGQFFTFTSPVIRMVPTTVGLLVYTTSDIGIISGGPNILTMFPNIYVPGVGLSSYNALAVRGGLIDFFTADSQVVTFDPNQGASKTGYPIGDQFFKYGSQTTTYSPATAYVAYHTQGLLDDALFVADGSTGWFRGVTNLAPDASITGPVWSPKANIVGGAKAIGSLEIQPGQHALLIGSTSANHPVLVRDSTFTTFTDNGTAYPSNFTIGSIIMANPGQLAELGFVTCEFIKTGTSPKLSVLLDEIQDAVYAISAAVFSAGSVTYTYTITSGQTAQVGQGITISGMADSGNNGTFTISAIGAGTFTVTNAAGVTRSGQTGTSTSFADLSGWTLATGLPPQDPPLRYGSQFQPTSTYSNRYYFAQSVNGATPPDGTYCRHMQMKIDFGSTDTTQNEILTATIYGSHWNEL